MKPSTYLSLFWHWLSPTLVLLTHLRSPSLWSRAQHLPEISKMSLVTSAGTGIIHHSKGCSLRGPSIPAASFPPSRPHPDIFCPDMTFFICFLLSRLTGFWGKAWRVWSVAGSVSWGGGALMLAARSGLTAPEWAMDGGSSGSPLQYKSSESQVRRAINGYFSFFKIRGIKKEIEGTDKRGRQEASNPLVIKRKILFILQLGAA